MSTPPPIAPADITNIPVISEMVRDLPIYVVGGYLARMALDLPPGDDIDITCDVDTIQDVRHRLRKAGYTRARGASSTGGLTADGKRADDGVMFREKWLPPGEGLAVDILVLHTDENLDTYEATLRLLDTFDYNIGRMAAGYIDGAWNFRVFGAARDAIHTRVPGWRQGIYPTSDERRAKWDALLPGGGA